MKHICLNDLGDRTGLPPAWLKQQAKANRIPFLSVGRRMMFDLEKVKIALDALSKTSGVTK